MVKTRTAAKHAPPDAEQNNSDGLEVISIGSLYNGPWDKKYWSSSRGKDRYPYPVGYQAVRAHNGTTYKMEILEGVNGPKFLISSDDGNSASGKTPDFAWEEFQKKGCPRIKIWHGKRLSSKMDGLELFGFKNPFIQRLLRELVADINGIAERNLESSNLCTVVSKTEHHDHRPNVGTYPDLLLCLEQSHVTGKRSRSELNDKKLIGGSRPWSLELARSRASSVKNEMALGQGSSTTHNGSEDENGTHNPIDVSPSLQIVSSAGKRSKCILPQTGLQLNPLDISGNKKGGTVPSEKPTGFLYSANSKTTETTENMSTEKPLHRSHDVELKMPSLLVTAEDDKLMQSCSIASHGCVGVDLCAPDTLDSMQENTSDSVPNKLDKNGYSEPACEVTSEDLLNSEHEEVLRSDSKRSSEKSDLNTAGQDVAKSMMSLLLPQAVPLLSNVATDMELTISPSHILPSRVTNSKEEQNEVGYVLNVSSSADKMVTEEACGEQGEKIHGPNIDPCSNTPITENMKSIVLDSFEYSQCEDLKTLEILSFDIDEAGKSGFRKEIHCPRSQEQLPGCDLPNGSSTCRASELDFKDKPHDFDICIPDSVLDDTPPEDRIISERGNDACSDMKENTLHVSFNSMQNDLSTAQDFTGGICNAFSVVKSKICHLKSMKIPAEKTQDEAVGKSMSCHDFDVCIPDSVLDDTPPEDRIISERGNDACSDMKENTLHVSFNSMQNDLSTAQDFTGEKTQDEAVGKTGNDETILMPSSQSPKLVYTRRKRRNTAPLQGNCSAVESTKCNNIELVTPEMHTTKGTVPPSKVTQINNSNDKLCKPDDSAGLLVEIPQTHSDILDGQSNLVEPNSSSQNPNTVTCENKCSGAKEAQFISEPEPMPQRNKELKNNLDSNVKFVGCYNHPMPVSSLLLLTEEDEIHICVLCGVLMGQQRTLFTYKVAIKEPNLGFPSVMAHTPILLPDPKDHFIGETMVERSGMQLTPGGQYIVLIGSMKTPNCREGKIDCCCSTCTSVSSEKNILKIVKVERGYVSVVATLEAVDDVHCILVCEPNRLVSVGESGRLQVWVMNSTWSEKIEYFIMPDDDSISPAIVELKRVPKCAHLVVCRNIRGDFSLWDVSKLDCISSFSASKCPVDEFFPISLFHGKAKGLGFSYGIIEEMADKLLETTNLWLSEQRETCLFLPSEENVAMWLLVSTTSDPDYCQNHVSTSSHCNVHTARSWRPALLAKNSIVFGSPLDPRTTAIGVSGGYGIISTSDGVVYMWELSRGSKLETLHHFQDGTVTCLATDESNSRGAVGAASSGGQLLLYLLHEQDSNK